VGETAPEEAHHLGRAYNVESRHRRADGVYRWYNVRGFPLKDPQGHILRWLHLLVDIDDRKRGEEELRRSEAFLAEGQHLAHVGNFSWHVGTGEIIWSEQLYRIFEFEPGALMTLDLIASRVYPDDTPLMEDIIRRTQRGDSYFEYEQRIRMPDHSIKYLHLIGHRARDDQGQTEYIGGGSRHHASSTRGRGAHQGPFRAGACRPGHEPWCINRVDRA
jgi:hypothetical protein